MGVGVVGAGIRGEILIRATKSIPGTRIVGVADIYDGHFARSKEILGDGIVTTRDYRKLLDNKDIQAIVIVTPDHWHKTMALDAMAAGKDVYIEKPMTHSWQEGEAIIAAAKKHQRIVSVGSQWASMPGNARAMEIIRSGRLGKVMLINGAFNRNTATGAWYYPVPPDASPSTIDWPRFIGAGQAPPVRCRALLPLAPLLGLLGGPADRSLRAPGDRHAHADGRDDADQGDGDRRHVPLEGPRGARPDVGGHRVSRGLHAELSRPRPTTGIRSRRSQSWGPKARSSTTPTDSWCTAEPMLENYTYSTRPLLGGPEGRFAATHDLDRATMRPRATATTKAAPPRRSRWTASIRPWRT